MNDDMIRRNLKLNHCLLPPTGLQLSCIHGSPLPSSTCDGRRRKVFGTDQANHLVGTRIELFYIGVDGVGATRVQRQRFIQISNCELGEDLSNPTATWYNLTISRRHHKCSPFERPFHELNGVCRHGCHHCGVENIPAAHEIARHVPVVATVAFDRHDVRPRRWALPTLAKTKFGHAVFPSLANTIYFCFEGRVGADSGGRWSGSVPRRVGPRRVGPPQVGPLRWRFFFFPSPATIFILSSLSWGSFSWNCGGV